MPESCTVIIGAAQYLDGLRQHAGAEGEVLTFGDEDPLPAIDAIARRRPKLVAVERLFAATARGAALINRIKADPSLAATEIRVVSHDGGYSRVSPRRGRQASPAGDGSAAAALLDYRGTRRAARFQMADGTEAQVDGAPAVIVDLSVMGAQVVTRTALKPNQRVRFTLADEDGSLRFNATVAWASFEIPKGVTRYRAGIEFSDARADAVEAFARRHERPASGPAERTPADS